MFWTIRRISVFERKHPMVNMASHLSVSGFVKTLEKAIENKEITERLEGVLFFETNNRERSS